MESNISPTRPGADFLEMAMPLPYLLLLVLPRFLGFHRQLSSALIACLFALVLGDVTF